MAHNCIRMYQKAKFNYPYSHRRILASLTTDGSEIARIILFSGHRTAIYWLETWRHILSILKTFKKVKRTFWMWNGIFYWSHHISAFSAGYLTFIVFVRLQTLVLFFLSSPGFCEFQCPFCKNTFIKGMFYFKLVWRKLKSIKF